jgi:hypothetical protein
MTQTDIDKLKAAKAKNPTVGRTVLARMAGVSEGIAKLFLQGRAKPSGVKTVKVATGRAAPAKGKTLADFRQTYDKATIVPSRVKAALKELGASGWEYEVQFARMAGVSMTDLSAFRDQFAGYIVNLKDNRRAWAGSIKTATQMKEMV